MDELGPDERPWLDALRTADEPSAADRARVRAAVMASVGAAGAAGALVKTGAVAKAAVKTGIVVGVWKIGLASVVLLAAAGGTTWMLTRPAPAPVAAVAAPVVAAAPVAASAAPVEPAPVAVAQADMPGEVAAPVATPSARVRVAGSARAPAPSPVARPETADAFEGEMALLTSAQHALERGDTTTAIGALSRHRREHPSGTLAVERDGLLAIASCDAKRADGRALGERFVAQNASSPLVARVRAACLAH